MKFNDYVQISGTPVNIKSGGCLFRQGEAHQSIYLVTQGMLKAYYLSASGAELVKSFLFPGEIIGSLSSAHWKDFASFSLTALEDSTLLRLNFGHLYSAAQSDLELAQGVMDRLLEYGRNKERREKELLTMPAEERYRALLLEAPDSLHRIKQKDIARYLGITPVALSRIRREIKRVDLGSACTPVPP